MRTARLLVAALVAAATLTACGSDENPPPPPALPSDEEVLAGFVQAEQKVDAAALTGALAAGAALGQAEGRIRSEWDAARLRIRSSLSPQGVVRASVRRDAGAVGPRLGPPPVRASFDFASMSWATWSLGLLYLGYDASGTVEHGPSTNADVTTTESTTVTAVKRGPVASVRLSTTRTQTSTLHWAVTQTGVVELDLPLCPDQEGVIAFDMKLDLKTTGSAGTAASSTVTDTLAGRTVATVDDDARLATIQVTGTYDHGTTAQGEGLAIAAGQTSIHVDIGQSDITGSGSGGVSDAQVNEARAFGGTLLRLAGSLAAARAGDFYEHGYCTEIQASPDDRPTEVAVGATQPFDVKVRHKWDAVELTDRITARLEGAVSVEPTGRTPTPTTVTYKAPNEKNRRATIHLESRSRRGIASKDVAVKTPGGYAIHDTWTLRGNGGTQKMDAVNCDSPYGPWHVVISGDLAAQGLTSLNAYFDITADPNTGTGTVRGEEHSVTVERHTYDGTSTGTAQVTATGETYLIKMEIDFDITWDTPQDLEDILGQDKIKGHSARELHVIAATEQECP